MCKADNRGSEKKIDNKVHIRNNVGYTGLVLKACMKVLRERVYNSFICRVLACLLAVRIYHFSFRFACLIAVYLTHSAPCLTPLPTPYSFFSLFVCFCAATCLLLLLLMSKYDSKIAGLNEVIS